MSDRRAKLTAEILENRCYQPDSAIIKKLSKALQSLSLYDLENLALVLKFKPTPLSEHLKTIATELHQNHEHTSVGLVNVQFSNGDEVRKHPLSNALFLMADDPVRCIPENVTVSLTEVDNYEDETSDLPLTELATEVANAVCSLCEGDSPGEMQIRQAVYPSEPDGEDLFAAIIISPTAPNSDFSIDLQSMLDLFDEGKGVGQFGTTFKTASGPLHTPHVRLMGDYKGGVMMIDIHANPVDHDKLCEQ